MSTARTYFDTLGLPVRFALDPAVLEARYRELSRLWHPDRHGRAGAAERTAVLQRATDLNEAYRTLKHEGRRAEYLLKLHGIDVAAETPDRRIAVAPAFLGEMMELREALVEARQAGDDPAVQHLAAQVGERMSRLRRDIGGGFTRLEQPETEPQTVLSELARYLVELRYYQRFRDEIDAYEESRAEAAALAPDSAGFARVPI